MALQGVLRRTLCALLECLVQVASGRVRYYFFESVAGICPVIMGFTFGKCVLAGSNKCFWSLDESSALLVCPTVFLALGFIPNILCFFLSFHSSSFYPWEADAASLSLSYFNYFNTPSPNFMSCLYDLGPVFCLLISFYFNFL